MELVSTLVLLGARERPPIEHAYAAEAREHFAAFATHSAVRRATAIASRGFDDFVAQVAAHTGPPPALVERVRLHDVGDGRAAVPADTIRALVAAARDFARVTDFTTFFADHAAYYRSLCDRVLADTTLASVAAQTERFFGTKAAAYEIVLMPLVPRLGVAPAVVRAGPRATLTAYIGPAGAREGTPTFRTGWSLGRVVLHEFAHQHVNPYVYGSAQALARSAALFAPVRTRLWRADHIGSWPGAVAETVVRASVAEMRGAQAGEEAERAELREQRVLGFAFIDSVAATLRAARRVGPPNAAAPNAAWWPAGMRRVIALLDRSAASPAMRALADPPFDAGMAQALLAAAPDSIAIIYSTEETDRTMQDSLRVHLREMRDKFVPGATLIADRDALARDLRGWTLWAVGTPRGNAWLRAHSAAVPARIDSTGIAADTTYRGRSLVFVGAVASPVDPRWPLLLTVGQRVEDLARGWWVVSADYAVVDGTRVLTRGTFALDGARRRFVRSVAADSTPSQP